MSEKRQTVPAIDVFKRSRRFDVAVKMAYVRAFVERDIPALKRAEHAYLEMIRAANDFYEHEPCKTKPGEFVSAFRSLIDTIRDKGFDPAYALCIDAAGEVVNAQHRVAAAAALGLDVPTVCDPSQKGGKLTYKRYRRRALHKRVAHYAIRQYLRFNECARVVSRWKRTPPGAFVWYAGKGVKILSFPEGVPSGFPQSHDEAKRMANRIFPDRTFPDWRKRANIRRLAEPWRRLRRFRYRILALLRRGKRRGKARFHVFELGRRQRGYDMLADFVGKGLCM